MYTAMNSGHGPFIIRYPRGYGEGKPWEEHQFATLEPGKGELMLEGSDLAVIAAGPLAYRALEAAMNLKEKTGWNPSIYNIRYIKPIDENIMSEGAANYSAVVTLEDGTVEGGLHGAVAEYMSSKDFPLPVSAVGIPDRYVSQGTQEELREECGMSVEALEKKFEVEKQKIDKKIKKVLEN